VPARDPEGHGGARKRLFNVPLAGDTITHTIIGEHGAAPRVAEPAAPGAGVIAGNGSGDLEAAGVHDVLAEVARLVERDQRVRDDQRPAVAAPAGEIAACAASRPKRCRPPACCAYRERNTRKTEVTESRRHGYDAASHPGSFHDRLQAQDAAPSALGLRRINHTVELPDRRDRGMLARVTRLVTVEEA
jgi:ribosomal protein L30/L7E